MYHVPLLPQVQSLLFRTMLFIGLIYLSESAQQPSPARLIQLPKPVVRRSTMRATPLISSRICPPISTQFCRPRLAQMVVYYLGNLREVAMSFSMRGGPKDRLASFKIG